VIYEKNIIHYFNNAALNSNECAISINFRDHGKITEYTGRNSGKRIHANRMFLYKFINS